MSVESIGTRIAAIQAQIEALTGAPPAAAGFDQALAGAAGAPGAAGPTAVAASAPTAAAGGTLGGGSPSQFDGQIQAAAAKYGLDPALLKGLIRQESNFDPNAGSPAGAQGLTQLMPGTARSLGVTDPHDPAQAIDGGAKYLKQQLDAFGGDVQKALAAYNAGPGAVKRYGGIPPYAETQNYVRKVMAYADEYRGSIGAAAPAASAAAVPAALPGAVPGVTAVPTAAASLASPMPAGPVASSPNQFGIV
jgi:soluble lytic murein transglycosylase-like protein